MSTPSTLVADRYRLVRLLGAGGMGVVWQAEDERLRRPVALKMLRTQPELTDRERELATDRAMREARITAGLHHPHAVTVFDVVEHDGQPCIVMQLIESTPLSVLLKEHGTLTPSETARIGAQVASALDAAHKMRIVHRDVKPGNILIAQDGSAMISDFGISHALGDTTITATGLIHGTPAYLAPEVARGLPTSFASDVFSLGSTLYAMLEGQPPFGADKNAIALLHRVARGGYPPPKHAGPLRPLLAQMLAANPKRRPRMASVVDSLSAFEESERSARAAAFSAAVLAPPVDREENPSAAATVPLSAADAAAASAAATVPVDAAPGADGSHVPTGETVPAASGDDSRPPTPATLPAATVAELADDSLPPTPATLPAAAAAGAAAAAAAVATSPTERGDDSRPPTAATLPVDPAEIVPAAPAAAATVAAAALAADQATAVQPTAAQPAAVQPTALQPTAVRSAALGATAPTARLDSPPQDELTAETERLGSAPALAPAAVPGAPPEAAPPARRRRAAAAVGIFSVLAVVVLAGLLLLNPTGPSADPGAAPSDAATPAATATTEGPAPASASPAPAPEATSAPEEVQEEEPVPPTSQAPTPEQRAVETVSGYYALMPASRESAWPLMTADYQENHAGGRGGYEAFWADIASVEVTDVTAVAPDQVQATLTYYYQDGSVVQEVTWYQLVDEGGTLKIAATDVISSAQL